MDEDIEDVRIGEVTALLAASELAARLPLGEAAAATVARGRRELRDILSGTDRRRLAVVVGPCSVHDPEAALEYAARLAQLATRVSDRLLVVMRTFFEKPRTTVGWKGLVNDPRLDGSCDIAAGLSTARGLLLDINGLGLPCATEFLDPVIPRYLADLVSWAAIGARTTESQTHREMASGLSMPVGFKNGTDGNLDIAHQAMVSARHPHSFLGVDLAGRVAIVRTRGNPDCHVVLRGGAKFTNYSAGDIARAADLAEVPGVARPVMVDCSHGNSRKDHRRQAGVAREVVATALGGESRIMGLQLESNLHEGRQDWPAETLRYGVSITDACMGWEETEALLLEIRDRLAGGPSRASRPAGIVRCSGAGSSLPSIDRQREESAA